MSPAAAILLLGATAASVGASELQLSSGLAWTRADDGTPLLHADLEPSLIQRCGDGPVTPLLGVSAGIAGFVNRERTRAIGGEALALLGVGLAGAGPRPRCDLLAGIGGGWWNDHGVAGPGGRAWGGSYGLELDATWPLGDRVRVGPGIGWSHRTLPSSDVEEWRLMAVVAISFNG